MKIYRNDVDCVINQALCTMLRVETIRNGPFYSVAYLASTISYYEMHKKRYINMLP